MTDITPFTNKKLGCIRFGDPFVHGALDLERYVIGSAPTVPLTLTRGTDTTSYQYGMLDNDNYGCCVPASQYHIQETFALRQGKLPHPWLAPTCLATYFAENGVKPGPPGSSSDQGTDPSAAMSYWQNVGLPGHKIVGFGTLRPNSPHIRRAVWEFGAVMYALGMPVSAQAQSNSDPIHWTYLGNTRGANAVGSWGGHAVAGDSFDVKTLGMITWGTLGDMDNAFANAYLEMVLVPLSHDALNSAGVGPAGFNFAQMKADLGIL